MKEFHIATEDGKNARVGITRAKSTKNIVKLVTTSGEEVTNVRIHKGATPKKDFSSQELVQGDPEVDLAHIGMILENGSRAYFKKGETTIEGGFKTVEILLNPDGSEKERRDFIKKKANIADTFPIKLGKRIPLKQAFRQFVFHNHFALFHDDGLKYEFLYNLAKSLSDKKEVAFLGGGSKGNAPLVFIDGGVPYRAFLYGEVQGDKYKLLVMISNQELKKPNREKPEAKTPSDKPEKSEKPAVKEITGQSVDI